MDTKQLAVDGAGTCAWQCREGRAGDIAFLDAQKEVDTTKKIGVQGYWMGGPMVVVDCCCVPDRVGAGASFDGGGLVIYGPTVRTYWRRRSKPRCCSPLPQMTTLSNRTPRTRCGCVRRREKPADRGGFPRDDAWVVRARHARAGLHADLQQSRRTVHGGNWCSSLQCKRWCDAYRGAVAPSHAQLGHSRHRPRADRYLIHLAVVAQW